MATIKSQMALNDGMSVVLNKITAALDTTLSSFEQIQRLSGNAMDVTKIEAARGALADAGSAVDKMADNFRRAAQEEQRLNQGIHEGTSALDGMGKRVASMVGAYMSLSAIKDFAVGSMDTANVQINAQRQLRTVLNNMGAEDGFHAFVAETSENTLENTLALDTSEAVGSYEALAGMAEGGELENTLALATEGATNGYTGLADSVDGVELGNTLTLDTDPAQAAYTAFTADVDGGRVSTEVQADTSQATAAYDAILAKASEIQGVGVYGDEAMIAGAAELATYFTDAGAILSMMDTLTDYAMGMSGGGALDATAMVGYATGLGKIMSGSYDAMTEKGFEFSDAQNAIIEGTATEAQIVAELGEEYLSMSQDMQAAAAINAVIAEGWGGLYEAMSNTPEGKLIQLNNTLGDIKENVGAGIYPAVVGFIDVLRSNVPQIEAAAMGLATMLGFAISFLTGMVEGAIQFGAAVAENWSWIEPIIWGAVAALIAYNAVQGIGWLTTLKDIAAKGAHALASAGETAAILGLIAAQNGLNAAIAACPVMWIVLAMIALIAVIVAVVRAVDLWGAKSTTVIGTICGLVAAAAAFIVNAALGLINGLIQICWSFVTPFIGIVEWILNVCNGGFDSFGGAVANLIGQIISWFLDLGKVVTEIIDAIFGTDWTGGLNALQNRVLSWGKNDNAITLEREAPIIDYRIEYGESFRAGAAFGDSISDKIGGMFHYELGTIEDYAGQNYDGLMPDDLGNNLGNDLENDLGNDLENDVRAIAGNTGDMADALEVGSEELKYLRDIAERDAINRFTTAEVKVDFSGMTNKIDSSMDLDGVIRELTGGFSEALVTAAEGVHV